MDICIISGIHLFKGSAMVSASNTVCVSKLSWLVFISMKRKISVNNFRVCCFWTSLPSFITWWPQSSLIHYCLSFLSSAIWLFRHILSCSLMLFISSVLLYDFNQLTDAKLGSLLLQDHLITVRLEKSTPRALSQIKEHAHKYVHIDLADRLVLSHPLSLQWVFPVTRMVFQDRRLPSVVIGERTRWMKLVAELLPPTSSSCGTHRTEGLSPWGVFGLPSWYLQYVLSLYLAGVRKVISDRPEGKVWLASWRQRQLDFYSEFIHFVHQPLSSICHPTLPCGENCTHWRNIVWLGGICNCSYMFQLRAANAFICMLMYSGSVSTWVSL